MFLMHKAIDYTILLYLLVSMEIIEGSRSSSTIHMSQVFIMLVSASLYSELRPEKGGHCLKALHAKPTTHRPGTKGYGWNTAEQLKPVSKCRREFL